MRILQAINRERLLSSFRVCLIVLTLGQVGARISDAGVIINISQVGADVVLGVSGMFVRPGSPTATNQTDASQVVSGTLASGVLFAGSAQSFDEYSLSLVSAPSAGTAWGTGTPVMTPPSSINLTGINRLLFASFSPTSAIFEISPDYVDNTPINGTMTFSGTTLSAMNLTNFGTFSYSSTGSIGTDTVVININQPGAAVPEPASMIVLTSLGLIGGYRRYRNSKSRRSIATTIA